MGIEMKNENAVVCKSRDYAVRIIKLYKYLCEEKKEYVLSKQLLRSGTSIGANVREAQRAQSTADFISKMNIALKEASETEYWLDLLQATDYLTAEQYQSISTDNDELVALLVSIIKSAKKNEN